LKSSSPRSDAKRLSDAREKTIPRAFWLDTAGYSHPAGEKLASPSKISQCCDFGLLHCVAIDRRDNRLCTHVTQPYLADVLLSARAFAKSPASPPDTGDKHMIRLRPALHNLSLIAFGLFYLVATESPALAVPVFARKYHTSCQTCHIVFPKLNAFGEAFRLRGYRLPGETEDLIKEPPISLGAPAYKKLWPQAVWPGEISSTVPLAVNVTLADVNQSFRHDDGSVGTVYNDLQFPRELNIFGAGTLGDHVSYFSEVTFTQNPDNTVDVELEHAHLAFDSPFGPEDLFHFKIGNLMPNLVDGFQEMQIATDAAIDLLFAFNPIGVRGGTGLAGEIAPSPISLPANIRGIEGYGIIRHRALWVAGVANGVGPVPGDTTGRFDGNNAKDVYARFDYKIGGMGLDGDTGGRPIPEKNWQDNSLRLGVFVYRGDGNGINFPVTTETELQENVQDVHFLRSGFYASLYFQNLNVFGAYLHGSDSLQLFDPTSAILLQAIEPDFHSWFTQADYVIYPWLQAAARYETVAPADTSVQSLRVGTFNLSALIRANVKAMVEYQTDFRDSVNHSINAVLRFAF
jgi:hypothetical protein